MHPQCQVCGRRIPPLANSQNLRRHYFRGRLCFGSGGYPQGKSTYKIEKALAHWRSVRNDLMDQFLKHRQERRNKPLPASFWQYASEAAREVGRLERRLRRLSAPLNDETSGDPA